MPLGRDCNYVENENMGEWAEVIGGGRAANRLRGYGCIVIRATGSMHQDRFASLWSDCGDAWGTRGQTTSSPIQNASSVPVRCS